MINARSVSSLALLGVALSAHALDAYSNIVTGGFAPPYRSGAGAFINRTQNFGGQFTSTATGTLTGFQVAMNENDGRGPEPYVFSLYSNGAADTLGSLLGTYSGQSTGDNGFATLYHLSNIAATGPAVSITSGTSYWLVASLPSGADPDENLFWNTSIFAQGNTYALLNGTTYYANQLIPAFSVQVAAMATPEPTTFAALGLGAFAMLHCQRTRIGHRRAEKIANI